MSNKIPLSKEQYDEARKNLQSSYGPMIEKWSASQVGNLQDWMSLLQQIMASVQQLYRIPGIQKSELCIDVVHDIAQKIIEENPAGLSDGDLSTVKTVLSSEGLQLLGASTSFLKQLISKIDQDGDGEISFEECGMFCCPRLPKNKKKKNKNIKTKK